MLSLASRTFFRSRRLLTLSLLMFSQPDYAGMIDKEGMQPWEICGMCHNANGISHMPKFPKLAGQKAGYLEAQIQAFREGQRLNDGGQMQAIVGEITQTDIPKIAAYFSSLPSDTKVASTVQSFDTHQQQMLQQGHALFTQGRQMVSACANCHTSKSAHAPWIDGQHSQYLEKQMHDFYSGERVSACAISDALPDAQMQHGGRLTEAEIEALAFYLSNLKLERK